jgi:hypothetical protein
MIVLRAEEPADHSRYVVGTGGWRLAMLGMSERWRIMR